MAKRYRFLGVSPTPAVCAKCGRECPERHIVVADESGAEVRLGTACAWKVAGVKATDRVDAPPAEIWDEPAGSLPSWMTGDDYDD